jgi:hypothetical protein
LNPPERLAFVLHDIFAVPFEAIAPILEPTFRRDKVKIKELWGRLT